MFEWSGSVVDATGVYDQWYAYKRSLGGYGEFEHLRTCHLIRDHRFLMKGKTIRGMAAMNLSYWTWVSNV